MELRTSGLLLELQPWWRKKVLHPDTCPLDYPVLEITKRMVKFFLATE
jgi:hypothetical protein